MFHLFLVIKYLLGWGIFLLKLSTNTLCILQSFHKILCNDIRNTKLLQLAGTYLVSTYAHKFPQKRGTYIAKLIKSLKCQCALKHEKQMAIGEGLNLGIVF